MRPGQKRDFARQLRCSITDAESTLWYHLRNRRLLGLKFRREVPVGPYVVDFACLERWVVVEVDGGQHNGAASDVVRDRFLAGLGFTVLRFWNNEVLFRREAVLQLIADAATANASAPFSRERERGSQPWSSDVAANTHRPCPVRLPGRGRGGQRGPDRGADRRGP